MKHYKKYIGILFILMLFYIVTHTDNAKYLFFEGLKVDTPSFVTDMSGDRKIVVDKSGQRFYLVNDENKIQFTCYGGSTKEDSFYTAIGLVTDARDHIYLLDAQRIEGGRRIAKERIVEYDSKGKFIQVLYELEHNEITYKNQINKLAVYQDTLYYFIINSDSFIVSDLEGNQKQYPYENADVMIVNFAMNPTDGTILFVDKSGKIEKVLEDGSFQCVYDGTQAVGPTSIPWNVAYSSDGTALFTDIGQRTINRFNEDGSITPIIYGYDIAGEIDLSDVLNQPIYYTVDSTDSVVTTDSYGICTYQNEMFTYDTEYSYSNKMVINNAIFWAFLLLTILGGGSCLIYGIIKLVRTNKIARIIIVLLACSLFLTVIFAMITTKNWNERMSDEMVNRAKTAAELTAKLIPKEEFKQIHSVDDYMNENYRTVRNCLRDIYMSDEDWVQDLYYEIYTIQEGMITGTFSIEDYFGSRYPYDWLYEGSDEQSIMKTQEAKVYKSLSTSEGSFIFVLYPIIDETTGESLGLLEVGTDLSVFNKENSEVIFNLFLNAIVISIAAILIALELLIFNTGKNSWKILRAPGSQGTRKRENGIEVPA